MTGQTGKDEHNMEARKIQVGDEEKPLLRRAGKLSN